MTMRLVQKALTIFLVAFSVNALAADGYTTLTPPQPTNSGKRIEVLEFFYYGCSHCFHLHPALSKWSENLPKDVQIEFVPVLFGNPAQEVMARAFYTLQEMGKLQALDDALYNAWNLDNDPLYEKDRVADFVAKHGINRDDFLNHYNASMNVDSAVRRARQMTVDYQIGGTPTLIVDGRYIVQNQFQPEDTIRLLNTVIDKVRKERRRHK